MMTVPMDNSLAPSPRELAERLYKKNIELESGLRKLAKSRVPSDPNTWYQIRENYEAIILEDHDFSEKHEVELALWQLHYRRIEEFRALINAAKSAGSVTSHPGGRTPPRPDSIKKIRSGFKTFLSESTGFYHDLILKIRAKFGLPLGFFSDGPESQTTVTKDEKKSAVTKKGLLSCHRCLIYLGDLARYKGSYGEGDSISREYAAASSYYKQAATLCPSNGNPHHQLAILASYAGDDLVSIYRYFRSLAADTPFSTARDNLIIAFEKNRQSFTQLPGNLKAGPVKPAIKAAGRGRGRGDGRLLAKDTKPESVPVKEREFNIPEVLKAFSTRFVRLNGILFTRTSLETFGEIFSSVKTDMSDLLSSGPEEELNFGQDAVENGLFVVRLIAILIFTVHNVNRESEGQSYAEILQRTVLLQNAFTAAFEFAGHIIKRCIQLRDAASSSLLPAIAVFIEWLACHPDIASGSDVEEKQAGARSFFWNQYVSFMNKLISSGLVSGDGDYDETCFFDMGCYDGEETGNRLALWEDFELRGFLPLVPAQLILDFSRNHSAGEGSEKEVKSRVQRILAAGRALMNVVKVDQKVIYFDPRFKRFVIGVEPPAFDDYISKGLPEAPKVNMGKQTSPDELNFNLGITQIEVQPYDGEEDEEEIVFKPTVVEKYPNASAPTSTAYEAQPVQSSKGDWENYSAPFSAPLANFQMPTVLHAGHPVHNMGANFLQPPLEPINFNSSKWLMEQAVALSSGLKNLNFSGNGVLANHGTQGDLSSLQFNAFSSLVSSTPVDPSMLSGQNKLAEAFVPSTLDSIMLPGMAPDGLGLKFSSAFPSTSRKNPVSRPVRHLGPPPGFSNVPSKQVDDSSVESLNAQNLHADDYSWLDGYQSASTKASVMDNSANYIAHMPQLPVADNSKLNGALSFPFPGKQISNVQTRVVNESKWQDFQLFDNLKPNMEQQFQQTSFQHSLMPEQQFQETSFQHSLMPEQHQAQSLWSGRYFV